MTEENQAEEEDPQTVEGADDSHESRRGFLRRLGSMTFLTAAVIKGALPVPASAESDGECGKKKLGQIVHADNDCSRHFVHENSQDADCGLFSGTGDWDRHEDNDCWVPTPSDEQSSPVDQPQVSDSDCGMRADGDKRHSDSECGSSYASTNPVGDQDCAGLNMDGVVHQDDDCRPYGNYPDQDCTLHENGGPGRHQDNDCVIDGAHGSGVDSDCSQARAGGGAHSDDDCSVTGTDNDCGLTGGAGGIMPDNDCHIPGPGLPSTDNGPFSGDG